MAVSINVKHAYDGENEPETTRIRLGRGLGWLGSPAMHEATDHKRGPTGDGWRPVEMITVQERRRNEHRVRGSAETSTASSSRLQVRGWPWSLKLAIPGPGVVLLVGWELAMGQMKHGPEGWFRLDTRPPFFLTLTVSSMMEIRSPLARLGLPWGSLGGLVWLMVHCFKTRTRCLDCVTFSRVPFHKIQA